MKQFLLISISLCLLCSCASVRFETPQPKETPSLDNFPSALRGTFVTVEHDTLLISKNSFECKSSDGKMDIEETFLAEGSATLKKYKNYFVVSMAKDSAWDVALVQHAGTGIQVSYIDLESGNEDEIANKLKKMMPVKEVKLSDGSIDAYIINPSKTQFESIIQQHVFSKTVDFKKIN